MAEPLFSQGGALNRKGDGHTEHESYPEKIHPPSCTSTSEATRTMLTESKSAATQPTNKACLSDGHNEHARNRN